MLVRPKERLSHRSSRNHAPSVKHAGRDGFSVGDFQRISAPTGFVKKAKLFAFERLIRHGLSVKKNLGGRHQARHVRVRSDPYVLTAEGVLHAKSAVELVPVQNRTGFNFFFGARGGS